jgi:acetyl esterase
LGFLPACADMSADPRAQLHADARQVVEEQYTAGAVPRTILTPAEARRRWAQLPGSERLAVASVVDSVISARAGSLPVRVYSPERAHGLLLYLHGGGWVIGNLESGDAVCRELALVAGCHVVNLDYRLAPEFPFPAAVEDTWDCLIAIRDGRLDGVDGSQPLAVGGMSAGGNLAAVAGLMARDERAPLISYLLLVVPVLDFDLDRPSYRENESGLGLERDEMRWFWDHYLPDAKARNDWRASPLRAASLSGLPPTSVVVADCDPLRDEGIEFANRLHQSGVRVTCTRWYGANHGFFGNSRIHAGRMALHAEAEALRSVFRAESRSPYIAGSGVSN